jgi:hypothetical protein
MPCVCEFYGVAIYFYYNDHAPPHFHAEYAEFEAKFLIDTLELFEGTLPRRARTLVIEWAFRASTRAAAELGTGSQR